MSGTGETPCKWEISPGTHLRLLRKTDAGELHALIEVNRDHLARWLPWAARQTRGDTEAFLRRTEEQLSDNDGFQMAVVSEGDIGGVIGFVGVDWGHRSTSLGYWLGEEYQGKGTMTKAVGALVDHALSVWELNRVEIRAATENRRSRSIPERHGFTEEGVLRQAERVEGQYLDVVVYSILAV